MVQPYIVNVEYIDRLIRRFALQTSPSKPDFYLLNRSIQPITNADELLRTSKMVQMTLDISGGGYTYDANGTVPLGKRWRLWWIDSQVTTASSGVVISDGVVSVPTSLTASSIGPHRACTYGLIMPYGWKVGMSGTGNGADNARRFNIIYTEEDDF